MNEQERLEVQGKLIADLKEENQELQEQIKVLFEDNLLLKKDKSVAEIDLFNQQKEVEMLINRYQELIDEVIGIRAEYKKMKSDYVKATISATKEMKELSKQIEREKNFLKKRQIYEA